MKERITISMPLPAKLQTRSHWTFLISLLLVLLSPVLVQAQATSITGTIKDEKGNILTGVTVTIKGTQKSTATDAEGKFTLQAVPAKATLVFSHVGFITREEKLTGESNLTIVLQEQTINMNEVVVVGYGTQKKINLTGAVATVGGNDLNKRIATNPTQLLQGKLPGLTLTQGSGEAGNENNVLRVRGLGTYSGAGTEPLVIVDGIPGSLSALDPANIASVSLLKDAASASIYGTRGANGVILVTTKTGGGGGFHVSYDYNIGITKATSLPKLVYNSAEFMQLYNRAADNSGAAVANRFSQTAIDAYANATDKNLYPNVNWLDLMLRTVTAQNHHLSLSGGRNGTSYNVGLGYFDQPDIMLGFSFKKYNLQLNVNSKVNERVNFGTSLTLNYSKRVYARQGSQDQFLSTLSQSPLYGPKLPDGSGRYTSVAYPFQSPNKNPVAIAENAAANTSDYYIQGNVYVNVKLLEGLEWKTSGGLNFDFQKTFDFKPIINQYFWFSGPNDPAHRVLDVGGQGLTVTDSNYIYPIVYSQLTYNKTIGDHSFKILAGTQAEYNKGQSLNANRQVFPNNDLREINAGAPGSQLNGGTASEWSLFSLYGRVNYDYKEKYLLEGNYRYDASSRFPPSNKWGFFPSVSAGWRVSKEKFIEDAFTWLNDWKLRASWGELGNQNIRNYPYQNVYDPGYAYPFGSSLSSGVRQNTMVDTDIRWEATRVFDIGTDITVLNNRLTLTADWYNKETYDILYQQSLPGYIGLTAPIINFGKVRNTGVEISAQYNDQIGDVKYSVGGNFQANKNKLVKFGPPVISNTTINMEGQPYGSFYLYEYAGIFQSDEEISKSPKQPFSPKPGYMKFRDMNEDDVIDANDRVLVSGIYPKANYSVNASAEWKNFDLTVFLYGSYGQKIFVNGWGMQPFNQNSVPTTDWLNAWTPQNPSTTMPMIYLTGTGNISNNASTNSTYYLKDASFLRIKNVQLGYNLPATYAKRIAMSSLRLYFAADNLATFSKFPGLDPERIVTNTRYVSHPQNRVLSFGVRAVF
jgi:TonB-linked SusC/RagA family outer membrane protein